MGKLDASMLRYMTKKHFRVLSAVEKAMKDHEVVPVVIVETIAALHHGGCHKILGELLKYRLVAYDKGGRQIYGYRLTNAGHDYLALNVLSGKDVITSLGHKIGVGKESDIYNVLSPDNEDLCLKLHRLGRSSFRQVKNKRDYHKNRSFMSWVHLSNASASKEFHFLKALSDRGFAVPKPIDCNRHAVVMELIDGTPMNQLRELSDPANVYDECMNFIVKLASCGLIHGDFNEFNIMVKEDETIVVYDLPQTVSTSHINAEFYFNRDVQCIRTFFERRFGFDGAEYPTFRDIVKTDSIDVEVEASGFSKTHLNQLEELFETLEVTGGNENKAASSEDEDNDDCQDNGDCQDDGGCQGDDVTTQQGLADLTNRHDSGCTLKTASVSKVADSGDSCSTSEADSTDSEDTDDECAGDSAVSKSREGELDGNSDAADGNVKPDSKTTQGASGNLVRKEKRRSRRTRKVAEEDWDKMVKMELKKEKQKEKLRTAQSRATKPRHRKNERRDTSASVKPAPIWDF